jgi:hypothetical protein
VRCVRTEVANSLKASEVGRADVWDGRTGGAAEDKCIAKQRAKLRTGNIVPELDLACGASLLRLLPLGHSLVVALNARHGDSRSSHAHPRHSLTNPPTQYPRAHCHTSLPLHTGQKSVVAV